MGYFDYETLRREREEAVRRLAHPVKEQLWSWLVLFTDRDSAGVIKEEFHRLAFGPAPPLQYSAEEKAPMVVMP